MATSSGKRRRQKSGPVTLTAVAKDCLVLIVFIPLLLSMMLLHHTLCIYLETHPEIQDDPMAHIMIILRSQLAHLAKTTDFALYGNILFALLTLTSIVSAYWTDTWVAAAADMLIAPIRTLKSALGSRVKAFLDVKSYTEFRYLCGVITDEILSLLANSPPVRIVSRVKSAVVNWCAPDDNPEVAVIRAPIVVLGLAMLRAGLASILVELRLFAKDELFRWWWKERKEYYRSVLYADINHLYPIALVGLCFAAALLVWVLYNAPTLGRQGMQFLSKKIKGPETVPARVAAQREAELRTTIRMYEDLVQKQQARLATKSQELEEAKKETHEAWETAHKSMASRHKAEEARSAAVKQTDDIRRELVHRDWQLRTARERTWEAEAEADKKISRLKKQIAELEEQLDEKAEQVENLPNELEALMLKLEGQERQLNAAYLRIESAEAREKQCQDEIAEKDAEIQQLIDLNTKLASQNQATTAGYAALQTASNELSQQLQTAMSFVQQKEEHIHVLEAEIFSNALANDDIVNEAKATIAQSHQLEESYRQTMRDMKVACDITIENQRVEAEKARGRAEALAAEVNDLQTKVGMAMRDAQRSHEKAVEAERELERAAKTIEILEHRLAKWEVSKGSQEILKRTTSTPGSLSTALENCKLKVAEKQNEIDHLKRQLEKATAATSTSPESADDAAKQAVQKLRAALETERRARNEDQVRWHETTRKLEEENGRLRLYGPPGPGRRSGR